MAGVKSSVIGSVTARQVAMLRIQTVVVDQMKSVRLARVNLCVNGHHGLQRDPAPSLAEAAPSHVSETVSRRTPTAMNSALVPRISTKVVKESSKKNHLAQ